MVSQNQGNLENQFVYGEVHEYLTGNHPKIICGRCKKLFSTWQCLERHILGVHKIKPFSWCHLCYFEFDSCKNLINHFKVFHTFAKLERIDNIHICDKCGKRFSRKWNFRRHFKSVHGSETAILYNCEFCKISFADIKKYHNHIYNVHTYTLGLMGLTETNIF